MNNEDDKKDIPLKTNPGDKSGPTTEAKRKTLLICTLLILVILLITYIYTKTTSSKNVDLTTYNSIKAKIAENPSNYVSKNGYLYDLENKDFTDGFDYIYVYESDFTEKFTSTDLKLYGFYTENGDTAYLYDENDTIKLSAIDFDEKFQKYQNFEEDTTFLNMSDADYMELSYMAMMELNKSSIDTSFVNVRYLAVNDDYAVMICSPQFMDDDLHGYVFGKIDGLYEVLVSDYQNIDNYLQFVNNKYAYMEVSLLTNMDINKYPKESFNTNVKPVVDSMLEASFINEDDYKAGVSYGVIEENLMYLEFFTGKAFVGVEDAKNAFSIFPVVDTAETKYLFEKYNDDPPYIILKQY